MSTVSMVSFVHALSLPECVKKPLTFHPKKDSTRLFVEDSKRTMSIFNSTVRKAYGFLDPPSPAVGEALRCALTG